VIGQSYAAEVGNQHVMAGNAALLSCQLPSFVADLVGVVGWVDGQGNEYLPTATYGNF
jgi:Down syndrome cell adhesion molecule-like protein 1